MLHLSEHYGEASPGSAIRIETSELDAFQAELIAKQYGLARPGIDEQPLGRDMSVKDPFGNSLIFSALT